MTRHQIIGKGFVALVFGMALGYAIAASVAADHRRGEQLTLAEYTKDFEHYKADLLDGPKGSAASVTVSMVMTLVVLGAYEALGAGVAWVIERVAGGGRRDDAPYPTG
ncbi:MAG TPA: hypothetical protein VGQ06_05355 [Gemmatimonadales bacterium]|jgi:hypothetical protein|nr:hypothetical protein [Gemmatimonadales bacterium]